MDVEINPKIEPVVNALSKIADSVKNNSENIDYKQAYYTLFNGLTDISEQIKTLHLSAENLIID